MALSLHSTPPARRSISDRAVGFLPCLTPAAIFRGSGIVAFGGALPGGTRVVANYAGFPDGAEVKVEDSEPYGVCRRISSRDMELRLSSILRVGSAIALEVIV